MKKYYQIPTECPSCHHTLSEEGKFLVCKNNECEALGIGSLSKWVTKLDVKDIGPSLIEALYSSGCVKDSADFYTLKIEDIASMGGLGVKTATKVLANFNAKKNLDLPTFIGGLNMPNVSNSTAELLMEAGFDTLDKLNNELSEDVLVKIPGIEKKTAQAILKGLNDKKELIKKLLSVGITIKGEEKVVSKSNKLEGLSFCFTGAIKRVDASGVRFTRDMMQNLVRENGGKISSVKKGLSHLVMADPNSTSSKAQKARKLGIDLLSEDDFFKMVGV